MIAAVAPLHGHHLTCTNNRTVTNDFCCNGLLLDRPDVGCPMACSFRAICSLSPSRRTPPLPMDIK